LLSVRGIKHYPGVHAACRWFAVLGFSLLVAGCGTNSMRLTSCRLALSGDDPSAGFPAVLAAQLPDGTLVLGGSREHGRMLSIRLRRVTQDCKPISSFGNGGTATVVTRSARGGLIDRMTATPGGDLLLAGTDGPGELVGRLLPSGKLDRSFGHGGWAHLKPHERPNGLPTPATPTATSIALSSTGAIFLGGDDGEAHCCVQDFVSKLSSRGTPIGSFGDRGSVLLPKGFAGSYETVVSPAPGGGAYALGEITFSGCGGPVLVRLRSDGSLDPGFAKAVSREIKDVTPHQLLFTPSLIARPAPGSLALLGQVANYCPGTAKHVISRGLALGLLPSGRIDHSYGGDGVMRFPDAGAYPLTSTSLVQDGNGRIFALTRIAYTRSSALNTVTVRAFSADGALDRTFGNNGARFISLRKLPRTYNANLALTQAPGGAAWLVAGFPKEIDLIPVQP
jgi:hypothetical protein